jgi:serine/threonine-protein kinase HipA
VTSPLQFRFTSLSRLKTCLKTAHNFLLSEEEARNIFDKLITTIEEHWGTVCEEAGLNKVDKQLLWRRQFLNPYSVEQ